MSENNLRETAKLVYSSICELTGLLNDNGLLNEDRERVLIEARKLAEELI